MLGLLVLLQTAYFVYIKMKG